MALRPNFLVTVNRNTLYFPLSGQHEVCPNAPQHPDGEHALPDQHHQEGGDGGMAQQEETICRSVDVHYTAKLDEGGDPPAFW